MGSRGSVSRNPYKQNKTQSVSDQHAFIHVPTTECCPSANKKEAQTPGSHSTQNGSPPPWHSPASSSPVSLLTLREQVPPRSRSMSAITCGFFSLFPYSYFTHSFSWFLFTSLCLLFFSSLLPLLTHSTMQLGACVMWPRMVLIRKKVSGAESSKVSKMHCVFLF